MSGRLRQLRDTARELNIPLPEGCDEHTAEAIIVAARSSIPPAGTTVTRDANGRDIHAQAPAELTEHGRPPVGTTAVTDENVPPSTL